MKQRKQGSNASLSVLGVRLPGPGVRLSVRKTVNTIIPTRAHYVNTRNPGTKRPRNQGSRQTTQATRKPRLAWSQVPWPPGSWSFDLYLRAFGLEFCLDLLGLGLADLLLHRFGGAVNEVLGFLQSQPGEFADHLDDLDLLVTDGFEDGVELRLLLHRLGSPGRTTRRCRRHGHRGSSSHAELLFKRLHQLRKLQHRQVANRINDFFLTKPAPSGLRLGFGHFNDPLIILNLLNLLNLLDLLQLSDFRMQINRANRFNRWC